MTYKGYVGYVSHSNERWSVERGGFNTVADATKWVSGIFARLMQGWAKIDENGIEIHGEVCDEGDEDSVGFTDMYDLTCGF